MSQRSDILNFAILSVLLVAALQPEKVWADRQNCKSTVQKISEVNPYRLKISRDGFLRRIFSPVVERISPHLPPFSTFNKFHAQIQKLPADINFFDRILINAGVTYEIMGGDAALARIPRTEGLTVFFTHPTGILDPVIASSVLTQVRKDFAILSTKKMEDTPELQEYLIPVDIDGGNSAPTNNTGSIRKILKTYRDKKTLISAGSKDGEIAAKQTREDQPQEGIWDSVITEIARRHPIVLFDIEPANDSAQNSNLFHSAKIEFKEDYPWIASMLLGRELTNKKGAKYKVHISHVITPESLENFSKAELPVFLRAQTLNLPQTEKEKAINDRKLEPIVPPIDTEILKAEAEALPETQKLVSSGKIEVIVANTNQIPRTVEELGRSREVTFRPTGQGSGKSRDNDRFDQPPYEHLVLKGKNSGEIFGAFRLARIDRALDLFGSDSLYLSQAFEFEPGTLEAFGPSIELSRAFVLPEHQGNPRMFPNLFKGIGKVIEKYPYPRYLFGAVSISNAYTPLSKQLMLRWLDRFTASELAKKVKPRNPVEIQVVSNQDADIILSSIKTFEDLSKLISKIEPDHRGPPPLLGIYMRLFGMRPFAYNLDKEFNDIDIGAAADITQTSRDYLERTLSRENAARYLRYHGIETEKPENSVLNIPLMNSGAISSSNGELAPLSSPADTAAALPK